MDVQRLLKRTAVAVVAACALMACAPSAEEQMMPGMEQPQKPAPAAETPAGGTNGSARPRTVQERREAAQRRIADEHAGPVRKMYLLLLSEDSPYRGILLAFLTVLVLLWIKKHTSRLLRNYADARAQKAGNVDGFFRAWNAGWKFVIAGIIGDVSDITLTHSVASRRQELSSLITEKVVAGFKNAYPQVKFCYPHSVVRYRWQDE